MALSSPNIGKLFGVQIQLHWTFILLLIFVLFLGPYFFGIIILLFICVLLHELAHSITAKRDGIQVSKIILMPLGGASIINMEGIKANQEFYIAMAGPISSILIGLFFGLGAIYTPIGMGRQIVQIMFELNILLGVFNLLPSFPLDGGRVLRSYLEKKRDELSATKLTVKIGNAVFILFIFGSIVYATLFTSDSIYYVEFVVLWDLIIFLFIYGGAQAELQAAMTKRYTASLGVRSAMSKNFITEKPETTLAELYHDVLVRHTHIALFAQGKSIKLVRVPRDPLPNVMANVNRPISSLGVEIPAVQATVSLDSAINTMRFNDAGVAAVVSRGEIIGVLLQQHVEHVVALHITHVMARESRAARQQKKSSDTNYEWPT